MELIDKKTSKKTRLKVVWCPKIDRIDYSVFDVVEVE